MYLNIYRPPYLRRRGCGYRRNCRCRHSLGHSGSLNGASRKWRCRRRLLRVRQGRREGSATGGESEPFLFSHDGRLTRQYCRGRSKQRFQVDRDPLGGQLGQEPQHRGVRVGAGLADGTGEVGTAAQDATDHAAAGSTRTHLDEVAHPLGIGGLDHLRIIDPLDGLRQDRFGRAAAVHLVGAAGGAAVEGDPVRRAGVEDVQVAVGVGHLAGNFTVNGGDALQREEAAIKHGHQVLHPLDVAADDALVGRVHDEEIDPGGLLEGAAHLACRGVDNPDAPVDLLAVRFPPSLACGTALAGEIAGEEGGCLHAG